MAIDTKAFADTVNTKLKTQLNPGLKEIFMTMKRVSSGGTNPDTGEAIGTRYDETWYADQLSTLLAEKISNIVSSAAETWIKTGKVTVMAPAGAIAVTGTPSAQANVTPITIVGEPKNPLALGGIE
jgi:hypothetical protein